MSAVDFASFVDDLATQSGATILPFFRTSLAATDKAPGGVFDPVTEADRASEVVMRQMIKSTFPEHGIIGEEYGSENEDAEFVWVLDPIDGTKAFISGLPLWGTLIGLTRNGRPCYGMMHQPFTRERFFGDGGVAKWRGPGGERILKSRACASLRARFAGGAALLGYSAAQLMSSIAGLLAARKLRAQRSGTVAPRSVDGRLHRRTCQWVCALK
jgi:myo-inositol-1(or 4)-monophosphatase